MDKVLELVSKSVTFLLFLFNMMIEVCITEHDRHMKEVCDISPQNN